ncbi:MAG: hypothetical protein Ct9H90mP25_3840 [Gammaproteobacteria bacterium]|nr:MAG: hypothetical protein Ct9H90mP25_3840 [Gammaproteobacteria bacterium]
MRLDKNPDIFDPEAGRLLRAGSYIYSDSVHLHSKGKDTTGHLEIGFRFHPKDYEPKYERFLLGLGNGVDISFAGIRAIRNYTPTRSWKTTQRLLLLNLIFSTRERMCLEAIWGVSPSRHSPVLVMIITGLGAMRTKKRNTSPPKGTILQSSGI